MSVGLALFARAPLAGRAKTRLIPALGAGGAAEICASLLAHALAVADAAPVDARFLFAAEQSSAEWFGRYAPAAAFELRLQDGDPDLGVRMAAGCRAVLAQHARVLLMGTDLVDITAADLALAARWLDDDADVVLGPTADGGYWLVGLRGRPGMCFSVLFDELRWGGGDVYPATVARIARAGLAWRALPLRHDIDVPADVTRHARVLAALKAART